MWPPTYICDLLDSLDVALCEFDAEHRAVRWNARFLERAGSVYLNSLRAVSKWISALVMPQPGLAAAR